MGIKQNRLTDRQTDRQIDRIDLCLLSEYRSCLMGVAAIFIVLCHTSISMTGIPFMIYNTLVLELMQCGVDIFLLLSGFGCYYSFRKMPNSILFYQKRLIRILIPFLIYVFFGVCLCLLTFSNLFEFLYDCSLIGFFRDGKNNLWFISALLVLYFLFPLLYKCSNHPVLFIIINLTILCTVLLISLFRAEERIPYYREIFVARIPVFCVGIVLGRKSLKREHIRIKSRWFVVILIICVIIFCFNSICNQMNKWTINRLLFLPISFSLCLSLVCLFDRCKNHKKVKINNLLTKIGKLSLELYLVFESVLHHFPTPSFLFNYFSPLVSSIIVNLLSVMLTLILAISLHKVTAIIQHRFNI